MPLVGGYFALRRRSPNDIRLEEMDAKILAFFNECIKIHEDKGKEIVNLEKEKARLAKEERDRKAVEERDRKAEEDAKKALDDIEGK
jgi:hypothetical protein